jgi:hypothetical protein
MSRRPPVDERRDVDLLVVTARFVDARHAADRKSRGYGDGNLSTFDTVPEVTDGLPGPDDVLARQRAEHEVGRVARFDLHDALDLALAHRRADLRRVVGDQRDDRRPGRDPGDLADEPGAVDDGLVDVDAGGRALVDRDLREPQVGVLADDAGGHRAVVRQPVLVVERELGAELCLLVQLGLQLDVLRAQRVAVLAHVLELALGVEGVAGPAEEVAHGLERLARALLDRRDDVEHAALHGVQAAAAGLAEIGGQEDERAGDEQSEDYPPPADRLVVHAEGFSKAWLGLRDRG